MGNTEIQMIDILEKIKVKRDELNYSQEYMAVKLGISRLMYSKLEQGIYNMSLSQYFDVLFILGFDNAKLFNEFNKRPIGVGWGRKRKLLNDM